MNEIDVIRKRVDNFEDHYHRLDLLCLINEMDRIEKREHDLEEKLKLFADVPVGEEDAWKCAGCGIGAVFWNPDNLAVQCYNCAAMAGGYG